MLFGINLLFFFLLQSGAHRSKPRSPSTAVSHRTTTLDFSSFCVITFRFTFPTIQLSTLLCTELPSGFLCGQ